MFLVRKCYCGKMIHDYEWAAISYKDQCYFHAACLVAKMRQGELDPGQDTLQMLERNEILRRIKETEGDALKAAAILGISERTIYRKLRKIDGPWNELADNNGRLGLARAFGKLGRGRESNVEREHRVRPGRL